MGQWGPYLVALDDPVLTLRWRWLPGHFQLAGCQRVYLHVLGGHGGGWGDRGTGASVRSPEGWGSCLPTLSWGAY